MTTTIAHNYRARKGLANAPGISSLPAIGTLYYGDNSARKKPSLPVLAREARFSAAGN